MNKITLSGNVGKDSELRYIPGSGTAVLNFNIAVERGYQKDKNNKKSDWFKCVIFGKYGEVMAEHIKQGAKVLLCGEMQLDYDKENKKTWPKVVVDELEITKWANDDKGKSDNGDEINPDDFSSVESDSDIPF